MEIKLKAGDTFIIPDNCEIFVENNILTVKEKMFEDGDILIARDINLIVIFKGYKVPDNNVIFHSYYNNDNRPNVNWISQYFSHATEEEKQKFFFELKRKGLRWNAETKTMEIIKKRVSYGAKYLYINNFLEIVETEDFATEFDDKNYNLGNYYLLSERKEAEKIAKTIRTNFENSLKVKP